MGVAGRGQGRKVVRGEMPFVYIYLYPFTPYFLSIYHVLGTAVDLQVRDLIPSVSVCACMHVNNKPTYTEGFQVVTRAGRKMKSC